MPTIKTKTKNKRSKSIANSAVAWAGLPPAPGLLLGSVQALSDFSGTLTGCRANNDDQV